MKIKPEDIIITAGNVPYGGFLLSNNSSITVHHKPSNLSVTWDKERSQHKNKNICLTILEDLLTEFKEGDIVVTREGIGEVEVTYPKREGTWVTYVLEDGSTPFSLDEQIAHTEEGFKYKMEQGLTKAMEDLEKEFEQKREQIKKKWRV